MKKQAFFQGTDWVVLVILLLQAVDVNFAYIRPLQWLYLVLVGVWLILKAVFYFKNK